MTTQRKRIEDTVFFEYELFVFAFMPQAGIWPAKRSQKEFPKVEQNFPSLNYKQSHLNQCKTNRKAGGVLCLRTETNGKER